MTDILHERPYCVVDNLGDDVGFYDTEDEARTRALHWDTETPDLGPHRILRRIDDGWEEIPDLVVSLVTDDEWSGYPFDEWAFLPAVGWFNTEDDAATPTEDALLHEIKRLRDENAALKAELDRITPVLNYLLDGN